MNMHKPLLLYNGKHYIALCTSSDYTNSICPISHKNITFIDSLTSNTILDITCTTEVSEFNTYIEEMFSIAMDIKVTKSMAYDIDDYFSIVTHVNIDGIQHDTHEYYFNSIMPYIIEYDTHSVFNLHDFLNDIDTEQLYRMFLILNIPCIVLNRNDDILNALSTFFTNEDLRKFEYEFGEGLYVIEFKTYYHGTRTLTINDLISDIEDLNQTLHRKIHLSVNNNDNPFIRSIGEIHVSLSFQPDIFKKQLFHVFLKLKEIMKHDIALKIIA